MEKIMGDTYRNSVFALFIKRHFPKIKSVLVVANAKGVLCFKGWLNKLRSLARNREVLTWKLPISGKNVVLFHKN